MEKIIFVLRMEVVVVSAMFILVPVRMGRDMIVVLEIGLDRLAGRIVSLLPRVVEEDE